jgi:hypothetical protein
VRFSRVFQLSRDFAKLAGMRVNRLMILPPNSLHGDLDVTPIGPIGLSQKGGNLQLCVPWFVGKNGARAGTKQDFLGV